MHESQTRKAFLFLGANDAFIAFLLLHEWQHKRPQLEQLCFFLVNPKGKLHQQEVDWSLTDIECKQIAAVDFDPQTTLSAFLSRKASTKVGMLRSSTSPIRSCPFSPFPKYKHFLYLSKQRHDRNLLLFP